MGPGKSVLSSISLWGWGATAILAPTFCSTSNNDLLLGVTAMVSLSHLDLKQLLSESPKRRVVCAMDDERGLWGGIGPGIQTVLFHPQRPASVPGDAR